MSNTATGPRRAAQHARRLDFLRDRPDLLTRLPSASDDVGPRHDVALDEAVRMLKFAGLYHPSSLYDTVRWGIRRLVSELRGEAIDRTHRWKSEACG